MLMKTLSCCAVVAGLAGLPAGLVSADPPATTESTTNGRTTHNVINFESFGDFKGREVYNSADENIATISDLIVDRGSGELSYVVVQTGDILGFGGKMIAIPYDAFRWDRSDQRVELRYSKESLQNMSEFSPESWAGLLTDDNADAYDAAYKQLEREKRMWEKDPYANAAKEYPAMDFDGVVHRVVRPSDRSGYPAYIIVNSEREGQRKVILGPSWYVMGYTSAPERGDKITITAYEIPREDGRAYVARTVRTPRGEIILRAADGHGLWNESGDYATTEYGNTPFRYTLLSEVVGKNCSARGEDCGEVQKAIIECSSGQVAFLAIDPNENVLGLGDDLHLVPWSVSRVYADTVALDASREMIVNSAAMPDDIAELESRSNWSNAYRVFDVDTPKFTNVTAKSDRERDDRNDGSK